MPKNAFTPKVNPPSPFAGMNKVPLERAISNVGKAHGLTPAQAGHQTALTNAGINPQNFLMGRAKVRE